MSDYPQVDAAIKFLREGRAVLGAHLADEIEELRARVDELERELSDAVMALEANSADFAAIAKREAVAEDIIDKVMDYGREIGNAAVCEANYDKVTARMHRKEAGDTLAEITAMLAASQQPAPVASAPFAPWPGGECPVSGDTLVDVKTESDDMRKATLYARRADSLGRGWSLIHGNYPYIRAWRLADPTTEQYMLSASQQAAKEPKP